MTVVVRGDSLSSKDDMNFGPMFHAVHLQEDRLLSESNVSRPQGSSTIRVLDEISGMNSEQGLNFSVQPVGTAQAAPKSFTWSTPGQSTAEKPLNVVEVSHLNKSNVLREFFSTQERDSYSRSTFVTLPYSVSRWLLRIAEREDAIVTVLRLCGLTAIVDRLSRLRSLIAEDPDEPDLNIESLRSFAQFFIQEDRLPVPEIGADPEGFLEAEWRIPANQDTMFPSFVLMWTVPDDRYWGGGDGVLAMKFLPSGLIRYAAVSGPAGQGKERLRASGVLSRNEVMTAIRAFTSRLVVQ